MIITDSPDDGNACRSLVCDSSGIIIAEMAYRCIVCGHISDSITDGQDHYQSRHMTPDLVSTGTGSSRSSSSSGRIRKSDGHQPKSGFVTCTVCNMTKFYQSVQRRYGQFTCMGCAKFFGRFLLKPRKYSCPDLGSCPLDSAPRCKACLLHACIQTYVVDENRMAIINANRPVRSADQPLQPLLIQPTA